MGSSISDLLLIPCEKAESVCNVSLFCAGLIVNLMFLLDIAYQPVSPDHKYL